MANQQGDITSTVVSHSFNRGMVKDLKSSFVPLAVWTHARNAINNSKIGDLGAVGNEPSNRYCTAAPYTVIGAIHTHGDQWAIFSTNEVDSEIGIFDESECSYTKLVNDPCLNFSSQNLVSGQAREIDDCTWNVYWADERRNPDRVMNLTNVPFIQNCVDVNGCITCTPTTALDCDAIRMSRIVETPCLRVTKGPTGGTLLNGSYFAVIAYTIKGAKVGDYHTLSNVQSIFSHDNAGGSIDVNIDSIDTDHFDEFELVVVTTVNQQTVAKRIGIYSTHQKVISLDQIRDSLPSVPLEFIPLRTPLYDRSDVITRNGDYLIKIRPSSKFDFNYQPLANQISVKWITVEYPADYYVKQNSNVGHMRDEVYPYFLRWIYDTGDKSSPYHIPGRAAKPFTIPCTTTTLLDTDPAPITQDAIEVPLGFNPQVFEVYNTANVTLIYPPNTAATDGVGTLIAEGEMGYWESTEIYPDNKPQIWNSSSQPWSGTTNPDYDLCGKPIRHHKFPDNFLSQTNPLTNHIAGNGSRIRLMGVRFDNIKPPRDNNGNIIPGIVGYEILRGSREGNKSVIAKGIINNMGSYTIEDDAGATTNPLGLYQNYPYNDLNADPFLSTTKTNSDMLSGLIQNYNPYNNHYRQDIFTFHSPETQFKNPFLSPVELKVYGELNGFARSNYEFPNLHPKHKHLTNFSFLLSIFAGIAGALVSLRGEKRISRLYPQKLDIGGYPNVLAGATTGTVNVPFPAYPPIAQAGVSGFQTFVDLQDGVYYSGLGAQIPITAFSGTSDQLYMATIDGTASAVALTPGTTGTGYVHEKTEGVYDLTPTFIRVLQAIPIFGYYMSEGADTFLRLIRAFMPFRQYALQLQSHGFYDTIQPPRCDNNRRLINESAYLSPNIQDFGTGFRVNNLYRSRCVALQITSNLANPVTNDTSRQRVNDLVSNGITTWDQPTRAFTSPISSHYVALKQRLRNQYGQLENIMQIPITTCMQPMTAQDILNNLLPPSIEFFGGDVYINRYTEKNTFFFFYNWLYGQPDGFEFDYLKYRMLPYPAYWADSTNYDINEFFGSIANNPINPASWQWPTTTRAFDRNPAFGVSIFGVDQAYFYTSMSGVRDFFVESEINTALRDWGETVPERHYDAYTYTNIKAMFDNNPDILKAGNFYKYDISLSVDRLFPNFVSWGTVQPRWYDPLVSQTCYTFYKERAVYSLPQQKELRSDNWLIYLVNNYKDFGSRITDIHPIAQNGAVIMFESRSPVMFQGVDTLQTDGGTKITIGDGGLFSQPLQNVINTDSAYEYGSCQSRLSIISTPAGLFWISQNQGRIFEMSGGLQEISNQNIKFWLELYLPYTILKDFPTFQLTDNPVAGVGCQSIYDNDYGLAYFCKKDYKLKPNLPVTVTYVSGNDFLVNGILPIKLGDPLYFEETSWTVSYDVKEKMWISMHDWHPTLVLGSKTHFMSILKESIWKHNDRCDSFCNYYGIDYPWEIEYPESTQQNVMVLRSLEYFLECYRYQANCMDKFHVLDFNFDEVVIYNSEQVSGLLRMFLTSKTNPIADLQYPIINPTSISILFDKEENKYRFNQFWDITDDRGEFNLAAQRPIWITDDNGYVKNLNPNNLNYNKSELEAKKFRSYTNFIFLRRKVSGNTEMFFILSNNKTVLSPR